MNIYNYNKEYVNALVNISKHTSKKDLAIKMDVTENTINLKLSSRTLIYINEGFILANALKMNLLNIFCPSDELMFNTLYKNITTINVEKSYNAFNFSPIYINEIIKTHGFTKKNICTLWNLKSASIYDKLKGDTKITVKEGIQLSELLNTDIETLFCPTETVQYRYYLKNKFNDITIDDLKEIEPYLTMESIKQNKNHIKTIIKSVENRNINELSKKWNISTTHCYNKINGKTRLTIEEALTLSKFIEKPLHEIFIP